LGQANQHQDGEDNVYQQTQDHSPAPISHKPHPLSQGEELTVFYVTAPAAIPAARLSYQKHRIMSTYPSVKEILL
jgi:hypothetical protein